MAQEHFRVVYDISNEGYLSLSWFVILWFIGAIVFSIVFFFQLRQNKFQFESINDKLAVVVLPLFLVVGLWAVGNTLSIQSSCLAARHSDNFAVISGQIEDYARGPKRETFTVSGIRFNYMDYDATRCGYKPAKGITLSEGVIVRISYRNDQTFIFEVAE
ncbi:MAG: hypothetical protein ABI791_07555 [Acidobacteriota bacterium]